MAFLVGFLCGLLLVTVVVTLVEAVILLLSVMICNKVLGPAQSRSRDDDFDDADDDDEFDDEEYDRPRRRRASRSASADPTPGFGKLTLIAFLYFIANVVIGIGLLVVLSGGVPNLQAGQRFDPMTQIIANLIAIPIMYCVLSGLCAVMLPTSIGRACLISLFFTMIFLALTFTCGFALGFALAAGAR